MISTKEFTKMLHSHAIENLAETLIRDSKGCTEAQIHSNLAAYDKIKKRFDWTQGSTLASPFRALDFRSIKERLSEGLYFAANYNEIEDSIGELKPHEFYINAVKSCLEAVIPNC